MQMITINNENFDKTVQTGKTFLYFTADFSPFAKAMEPVYAAFLERAADYDVKVSCLPLTQNITLGQRLQIKELPCMLVYRDGMRVDTCTGIVTLERYENMLKFY